MDKAKPVLLGLGEDHRSDLGAKTAGHTGLLIAPPAKAAPDLRLPKRELSEVQNAEWILPDLRTETGRQLRDWLDQENIDTRSVIDCDSLDLAVNLVGLGLGTSLVPHRVLPLYRRARAIRQVRLKPVFERQVSLVSRVELGASSDLVRSFADELLFS